MDEHKSLCTKIAFVFLIVSLIIDVRLYIEIGDDMFGVWGLIINIMYSIYFASRTSECLMDDFRKGYGWTMVIFLPFLFIPVCMFKAVSTLITCYLFKITIDVFI